MRTAPSSCPTAATCWSACCCGTSFSAASERALRLLELRLEWARVDLGEHLAFADALALAEEDLVEPPVHLRLHGDGLEGDDAPQPLQVDGHVAAGRHRHGHRNRALRGGAGGRSALPFPGALTTPARVPPRAEGDGELLFLRRRPP